MFCDGKTTGTFKSVDEPFYVTFVSIIPLIIIQISSWRIKSLLLIDKVKCKILRLITLTIYLNKLYKRKT